AGEPTPGLGVRDLQVSREHGVDVALLAQLLSRGDPQLLLATRFTSESAEPSSSTSVPGCAARISSENRSVANWCSVPLAFSTVKVTSPRRAYALRSSRAGTGTGAGREPPPQAAVEQSARSAAVLHTVTGTG